MRFFLGEKQVGEPVTVGERVLRPESRRVGVVLPLGGFVWQFPTAVFITHHNKTTRLPVVDVTRTAVWMIWGLMGVGLMLVQMNKRRLGE
ncbi:MAG: hypothetical protein KDE56_06420 [Anaerolineales bacterium]|nr:hypothetical protein [Anaerolineales bacterium]